MEVPRPSDARSFLDLASPLLVASEARHNLILGIAATTADHPEVYPTFHSWVVTDGVEAIGAALMTPPYDLVLADPAREEALEPLIAAVREDGVPIPGVVGNVPAVHAFARAWSAGTGTVARTMMSQGVYALTDVRDVPVAPGSAREAGEDDRHLLEAWILAFGEEAMPEPDRDRDGDRLRRSLDVRLSDEDSGLWLWEDDGGPVSLAGYGGRTPGGIRIGPVYTPPERRRRGYATSVVAEMSRFLLARGHRSCFLYTDLSNPTSNKIYVEIGYVRVCDSVQYRFDPE
jgi:predicted GNAT family acetyltransferase